jgi:hypothetical protein
MNKTFGLLLLPLVPLSAIGVVSLVDRALPSTPPVAECRQPVAPIEARPVPLRAPFPAPAPARPLPEVSA